MKIKVNKNILIFILTITMILPMSVNANNKDREIFVVLMDKTLDFEVSPRNIDDRVMVPLRKIFEEIGLEVGWFPDTKTIIGKKGDMEINLQVGNRYASINGEGKYIDAPPIIIDGATLVPIRFIAESTGLDVTWDNSMKTVYIKQPIKGLVFRESADEFIGGHSGSWGLNLGSKGTVLSVDGKFQNSGRNLIGIYDKSGNVKLEELIDCKDNGDIKTNIDLKGLNGNYTLNQFIEENNRSNSFNGYYINVPIKVKDNSISFELSPTYEENYNSMIKRANLYTGTYLDIDYLKDVEKEELTRLTKSITKGRVSDYEKILAIHDWIIENIYYNFDGLYSGEYGDNDAYRVYKTRKAVCQGYANLFQTMGRIENIPTRVVDGYALGSGTNKTWNKDSLSKKSNHAWNEVFIDDRWIIIDTTWDNTNAYKNGEFNKGESFHRYFDPSLQYFSISHRILSN